MVCVCVVDHYHMRVEIHQMAQTHVHKKMNKIHSVEIRSLTTDACILMKRTHHPPLTHHLVLLTSWASF